MSTTRSSAYAFDREHLALLGCALAPGGVALGAALAPLLDETFRWDRLGAAARAHRMRPQLDAALSGLLGERGQARELREELGAVAGANAGHARFLSAELLAVLDCLRLAGVQAVPFKGPAFAELVDRGAALREMDDLDLLLRVEDIAPAARALTALAYDAGLPPQAVASRWLRGAGHELAMVRRAGDMLVELHWRVSPPWYPETCTPEQVLSRSTAREFLGTRISWPCAEHLLLIHVADGMKSCGRGIRWAADLVAILRTHRLRWDEVRASAESHGALDLVRIALATAEVLCRDVAARLALPAVALALPPEADRLAREGMERGRLAAAVEEIRGRMAVDANVPGAWAHFRWALRTADRPFDAAVGVGRYLCSPAIADLRRMPERSLPPWAMRLRAAGRRLRVR